MSSKATVGMSGRERVEMAINSAFHRHALVEVACSDGRVIRGLVYESVPVGEDRFALDGYLVAEGPDHASVHYLRLGEIVSVSFPDVQ